MEKHRPSLNKHYAASPLSRGAGPPSTGCSFPLSLRLFRFHLSPLFCHGSRDVPTSLTWRRRGQENRSSGPPQKCCYHAVKVLLRSWSVLGSQKVNKIAFSFEYFPGKSSSFSSESRRHLNVIKIKLVKRQNHNLLYYFTQKCIYF